MAGNPLSVRLQSIEMDEIIDNPELLRLVRRMTLYPESGMNMALDYFCSIRKLEQRSVDALGIFAYLLQEPIGWALFTYEGDTHSFEPANGQACAQVYVREDYRRQGVGTELMEMCARLAKPDLLRVYEWSAMEFFQPLLINHSHISSV